MHKRFYASGFLYHSPSQQILLQQANINSDTNLLLFGNKCHSGNDPQTIFQHCIEKALGKAIAASSIHPIYDYIHDTLGEQFVFFIEVSDISPATYPSNTKTGWYPLSKLAKLTMNEQTRHDITIGERVIRSRMEPPRAPLAENIPLA